MDPGTRDEVKSFGKLQWRNGKEPDSKRDNVKLLVPQVEAWKERWARVTSSPEKKHAFARKQVDHMFRV